MTISAQSEELDVLDAILPFDRRDQIAELLTDDVATLKHLSGVGAGCALPCSPAPVQGSARAGRRSPD